MDIGGGCDFYPVPIPLQMHQRGGRIRDDIDGFIVMQNERLRVLLQQQRSQHLERLVKVVEGRAMVLLQQKDEEIGKAKSRGVELEQCLRAMEAENEAWQRLVREKQATVAALNSALDQVRELAAAGDADDAESCSTVYASGGVCKGCLMSTACVLMLPCRHLCCCKSCDLVLGLCPVCESVKEASLEVYIN